jgi:hypothetical protein
MPGTQIQVIRIVEDELKAEGLEIIGLDPFHRAKGTDRHESRGLDEPMSGYQGSDTSLPPKVHMP